MTTIAPALVPVKTVMANTTTGEAPTRTPLTAEQVANRVEDLRRINTDPRENAMAMARFYHEDQAAMKAGTYKYVPSWIRMNNLMREQAGQVNTDTEA